MQGRPTVDRERVEVLGKGSTPTEAHRSQEGHKGVGCGAVRRHWYQVVERGYEGLVAKDPASPYRSGRSLV